MGRVVTPKYRVEFSATHYMTPACWNGRATEGRLEAYVKAMNASFQPGGSNAHLTGTRIHWARLVRNSGPLEGDVVARYQVPVFEVTT